jgi:hypothetical protein
MGVAAADGGIGAAVFPAIDVLPLGRKIRIRGKKNRKKFLNLSNVTN